MANSLIENGFFSRAQNHQVVGIVHDPQDVSEGMDRRSSDERLVPVAHAQNLGGVSEGMDRRSSDEPLAAVCRGLVLLRAHRHQLRERCGHIVDVPVHHNTGWADRRTVGRVAAIDQAQFVLIVAEAKLDIAWTFEVWLDTQQFGIPVRCRREINRPKN